jgi:uncharacterized protein YndB with AHSA1/START domain
MTPTIKKAELTLKRTIPAPAVEVFDAWLDPDSPCNPWNDAEKLIFDPRVDGLFYWVPKQAGGKETPHYGRFTILDRPNKIQSTWMSPYTHGLESVVTITLVEKGEDTLLTLHHANLPNEEMARAHEEGWGQFLGLLTAKFGVPA